MLFEDKRMIKPHLVNLLEFESTTYTVEVDASGHTKYKPSPQISLSVEKQQFSYHLSICR